MCKKTYQKLLLCLLLIGVLVVSTSVFSAPKKVKLVYWTHWEQNPIFNAYYEKKGKEFGKLHPEVEGVEVVVIPYSSYEAKFFTALTSGKGAPDIFNAQAHDWAGRYQYADPMPEKFEKRVNQQLAEYLKPVGVWEGKRYGIPIEAGNFQQLYINVDMFEEVGLDSSIPPKTYDDLLEYAKRLTKYDKNGKIERAGFAIRYSGTQSGITDKYLTILDAFGGSLYDTKRNVASGVTNSKEAVEALHWFTDLVHKHKVSSLDIGVPETAFGQGRTAMILRESWVIGWLENNAPDIRFKVCPAPSQNKEPGGGNLFPWANMVYANGLNKDLAWEFMEFVFTPKNDLEQTSAQGILPVCAENYESEYVKSRPDYESVKSVLDRSDALAYSYYGPKMNELANAYGDAVLNALYGRMTPKQALDEAAVRMDAILKQ